MSRHSYRRRSIITAQSHYREVICTQESRRQSRSGSTHQRRRSSLSASAYYFAQRSRKTRSRNFDHLAGRLQPQFGRAVRVPPHPEPIVGIPQSGCVVRVVAPDFAPDWRGHGPVHLPRTFRILRPESELGISSPDFRSPPRAVRIVEPECDHPLHGTLRTQHCVLGLTA
jgi:hypothetical protein